MSNRVAIQRVCQIQHSKVLIIILAEDDRLRSERLTYCGYGKVNCWVSPSRRVNPTFTNLQTCDFSLDPKVIIYIHCSPSGTNASFSFTRLVTYDRWLPVSSTIRTDWDTRGSLGLNAIALAVCSRMARSESGCWRSWSLRVESSIVTGD